MKLDSWVCIENSIGDVFKKFHINITVAMLLQKFHLGERGLSWRDCQISSFVWVW